MSNEELLKLLYESKDEEYKKFNDKTLNANIETIGVRTPVIKKIATEISRGDYEQFLSNVKYDYYEQVLVAGLVISNLKDIDIVLSKLDVFIDKIDNWAVCDMVIANCKIIRKHLDKVFKFVCKNISSTNPWRVRVCFVILLDYFVTKDYINDIFTFVENDKNDFYYVMMAKAWLISECYVKFPLQTFKYLKKSKLDKVTYNKAISKICDSYRVSKEDKIILKSMKKKSNNA